MGPVVRLSTGSSLSLLSCIVSRNCAPAGAFPGIRQAGVGTCQQFHSSTCSQNKPEDVASSLPEDSSSSPGTTTAAKPAAGPVHARHISLNHPELNIHLRYNKDFIMDPDRRYAIGHVNDLKRKIQLELKKALAAQRLSLRDEAAAAPHSKQPPLREQMLARLSELQQACRK